MSSWTSPSAAHQRACANGKSMLTTAAFTPSGSSPKRPLNFLDSSEQTLVSSEGTTMSNAARLPSSTRISGVTVERSPEVSAKLGAGSPRRSAGPSSVIGCPLNVTMPARSWMLSVVMYDLHKSEWNSGQHILKSFGVAGHYDFHRNPFADGDVAAPAVRRIWGESRPRRTRYAQRNVVADELLGRPGGNDALQRERPDDSGRLRLSRRPDETLTHFEGRLQH